MIDVYMAGRVVDFLNELHKLDPILTQAVFDLEFPCNTAVQDHTSIQCSLDSKTTILGLLNGLCGANDAGWGGVAKVTTSLEDSTILEFTLTPERLLNMKSEP